MSSGARSSDGSSRPTRDRWSTTWRGSPKQQGAAIFSGKGKKGTRPYFDVDDINAGIARVKELGGQADDAMPVPQMGWFATATDPHGNEFGLWQTDPSAPTPEG